MARGTVLIEEILDQSNISSINQVCSSGDTAAVMRSLDIFILCFLIAMNKNVYLNSYISSFASIKIEVIS